jgi:hypothetical protein
MNSYPWPLRYCTIFNKRVIYAAYNALLFRSHLRNAVAGHPILDHRKLLTGWNYCGDWLPVRVPVLGGILRPARDVGNTDMQQWGVCSTADTRLSTYGNAIRQPDL